jgi:hypothetical protein
MHTVKLNIQDSVFDKVIYFLQNLPKNEVEIIEDTKVPNKETQENTQAFSNHSASLINEWKDEGEDAVWK